ncbi:hypothetical protein NKJ55_34460, partial [Mesorhizobium sp. M0106]|uniref:hypothetical protein n=1 Tax=Mesorhizobium sp. M0106 TaxID=2956880 RepID=UPI003334B8F6
MTTTYDGRKGFPIAEVAVLGLLNCSLSSAVASSGVSSNCSTASAFSESGVICAPVPCGQYQQCSAPAIAKAAFDAPRHAPDNKLAS